MASGILSIERGNRAVMQTRQNRDTAPLIILRTRLGGHENCCGQLFLDSPGCV